MAKRVEEDYRDEEECGELSWRGGERRAIVTRRGVENYRGKEGHLLFYEVEGFAGHRLGRLRTEQPLPRTKVPKHATNRPATRVHE